MTQTYHNNKRIAIFPGSFDPFTIGHQSIVERGMELFDKIYIAVGYNENKSTASDIDSRVNLIKSVFYGNDKIEIISYSGLTVECAKRIGAKFMLRGVRCVSDFEYERNLAEINRKIGGIETILLYTLPEQSFISSSMVRELTHNGVDVSEFIAHKK